MAVGMAHHWLLQPDCHVFVRKTHRKYDQVILGHNRTHDGGSTKAVNAAMPSKPIQGK
jgi:hypothetical protein